MAATETRSQVVIAYVAAVLLIALVVIGLLKYGLSSEVHQRIWRDISDRPSGPMMFRFILQPTMAAIAAFHDGVKDAATGRSPYFWMVLTNSEKRAGRLREGIISTARIILLGLGMDAIYQYVVLKSFYPGEMVIIATLLAFVPYLLLRGPFARLARWCSARNSGGVA